MEVIASPSCLCLLDNYVHRLVQNKEDGKLVEVAGQGGMVGCQSHSQTGTSFPDWYLIPRQFGNEAEHT